MKFKLMIWILVVLTLALGREYLVLHQVAHGKSALWWVSCRLWGSCQPLSVQPGRSLGHAMGWWGMLFIMMTNLYSLRKHWGRMQRSGNVQNWLKWHMIFGLLGPALIIFHTNFKVGGLVALSFWSMIIVMLSGIVGRFFYMELLVKESELAKKISSYEQAFEKFRTMPGVQISEASMAKAKNAALRQVGCDPTSSQKIELGRLAFDSVVDSVASAFNSITLSKNKSLIIRHELGQWAHLHKRLKFAESYNKIMGYWHTVHLPFTKLMYVVVIIHIISSLMFGLQ